MAASNLDGQRVAEREEEAAEEEEGEGRRSAEVESRPAVRPPRSTMIGAFHGGLARDANNEPALGLVNWSKH